jgi:hypothetical protein
MYSDIFFLIKAFLLTTSRDKKRYMRDVWCIFFFSSLLIYSVNGLGYGIFETVKRMFISSYGHIHLIFEEKFDQKESIKIEEKISSALPKSEVLFYGCEPVYACQEEEGYRPLYLIPYRGSIGHFFIDKVVLSERGFYVGQELYNMFPVDKNIKLLIFNNNDMKKRCIFYSFFPILLRGYVSFYAEELNKKAIIIPEETFYDMFERKTFSFLNIYLDTFYEQSIDEIALKVKNIFEDNPCNVLKGEDMSSDYALFLILFRIGINAIFFLLVLFLFFFLRRTIYSYCKENSFDYCYFLLIGIDSFLVLRALLFLFSILFFTALGAALVCGKVLFFFADYYQLLSKLYSLQLNFIYFINYRVLFFYFFVYYIFIIILIYKFYKKVIR